MFVFLLLKQHLKLTHTLSIRGQSDSYHEQLMMSLYLLQCYFKNEKMASRKETAFAFQELHLSETSYQQQAEKLVRLYSSIARRRYLPPGLQIQLDEKALPGGAGGGQRQAE